MKSDNQGNESNQTYRGKIMWRHVRGDSLKCFICHDCSKIIDFITEKLLKLQSKLAVGIQRAIGLAAVLSERNGAGWEGVLSEEGSQPTKHHDSLRLLCDGMIAGSVIRALGCGVWGGAGFTYDHRTSLEPTSIHSSCFSIFCLFLNHRLSLF